jgi:hypothetical protein
MKRFIKEIPDSFPNVKSMFQSIPRQLWYIFVPETDEGWAMLEADILAQKKRDKDRDRVMAIQKLCGFMLRPNEPLREVVTRAKKAGLSEDEFPSDSRTDNPNSR